MVDVKALLSLARENGEVGEFFVPPGLGVGVPSGTGVIGVKGV